MIWVARVLWLLCLLFGATAVYVGYTNLVALAAMGLTGLSALTPVVVSVVALVYATSGLLILRHRSGHPIGWLLLVPGTLFALVFATQILGAALLGEDDALASWFVWFSALTFWPAIILAGPVVALVFPDGGFAGPRWRIASLVFLAIIGIAMVSSAFRPSAISGVVPNPLALRTVPAWIYGLLDLIAPLVIFGLLAVVVGSIVVRFRRATGDEGQQLKWFTFAVILWAVIFGVTWALPSSEAGLIWLGSFTLMPIAIVMAVTRNRLYEIDTLINRTLVYVPLVGIVAGLYAALVVLFGRLFTAVTGDTSDAAAVISALILAALFTPLRKAIEAQVDRNFKPASTTASPAAAINSPWNQPEFESAVERVVNRALARNGLAVQAEGRSKASE
jgi:hypothetical protein